MHTRARKSAFVGKVSSRMSIRYVTTESIDGERSARAIASSRVVEVDVASPVRAAHRVELKREDLGTWECPAREPCPITLPYVPPTAQ
jgi:hypothetical protein